MVSITAGTIRNKYWMRELRVENWE
jgi:hypothetical protein